MRPEAVKSVLFQVSRDSQAGVEFFELLLSNLHRSLGPHRLALEIFSTHQNTMLAISGEEAAVALACGEIYNLLPDSELQEVSDCTAAVDRSSEILTSEVAVLDSDLAPLGERGSSGTDPLAVLLAIASQTKRGERLFVQIVFEALRTHGFSHSLARASAAIRRSLSITRFFRRRGRQRRDAASRQKMRGPLFRTNIRVAVVSHSKDCNPAVRLEAACGALRGFNASGFAQLVPGKFRSKSYWFDDLRERSLRLPYLLSPRDIASLYHLPPARQAFNIARLTARRRPPPTNLPSNLHDPEVSFIGHTLFRGQRIPFGIKAADRLRHTLITGRSGNGKSRMLELLIRNDIFAGRGVAVFDPQGDLVDAVLRHIPERRTRDVVIIDPDDFRYPTAFNPFANVPEEQRSVCAEYLCDILQEACGQHYTPMERDLALQTFLLLLDAPGSTFLLALELLTDPRVRAKLAAQSNDRNLTQFWLRDFPRWGDEQLDRVALPFMNKLAVCATSRAFRSMIGQPHALIDFEQVLSRRKILLVKLSRRTLTDSHASLLGSLILLRLKLAASFHRNQAPYERRNFGVYFDELQMFAASPFRDFLPEARHLRIACTLSLPSIVELSPEAQQLITRECGTLLTFSSEGADLEWLHDRYDGIFDNGDFCALAPRELCLRLVLDGERLPGFSGRSFTIDPPEKHHAQECIAQSRMNYARPLDKVESLLQEFEAQYGITPIDADITTPQNAAETVVIPYPMGRVGKR